MEGYEAVEKLVEKLSRVYELFDEMKDVIREVASGDYQRERWTRWLVHIERDIKEQGYGEHLSFGCVVKGILNPDVEVCTMCGNFLEKEDSGRWFCESCGWGERVKKRGIVIRKKGR